MTPALYDETRSRLGEIRDLERELVTLHGFRAVGGYEVARPGCEPIPMGCAVAIVRRECREAGQLLAREQQRGERQQETGNEGSAAKHGPVLGAPIGERQSRTEQSR